jgi:hypothetical protein
MSRPQRQGIWLLSGLALFVAIGVQFLNYAPDDIYIPLRYAKHIAAGAGPFYNAGERVEGFSNPLFLGVLAVLQPLLQTPAKMVTAAKAIGLVAALLALLTTAALARRDPEASEHWGLTPLLFGLAGYPAFWAASGMETGLHLLLLVLAIGGYIRALETGRRAWRALCGLAFGALALSRPEGAAFIVAALAARAALLRRDGRKPDFADLAFAALALAPPACFAIWRHATYGVWLPNTFYAKAGAGLSTYADGVRYLIDALGPTLWGNALLLPLVALPLSPWRKATPRTAVLLAAVAAQAAFVVIGGGDWMPGWRFAVPCAPLLALLAPAVVARLETAVSRKRLTEWTAGWRGAVAAALILLPVAAHLYAVKQLDPAPSGWRGYRVHEFFAPDYQVVAGWLAARAAPTDWLATGEAGLIPYLTDLPTIDCFGLTDAHLARRPGKRHEKVDPDYILGRRPRFLVIGGARQKGDKLSSDFAYGRSLLDDPRTMADYRLALRLGSFLVFERNG